MTAYSPYGGYWLVWHPTWSPTCRHEWFDTRYEEVGVVTTRIIHRHAYQCTACGAFWVRVQGNDYVEWRSPTPSAGWKSRPTRTMN